MKPMMDLSNEATQSSKSARFLMVAGIVLLGFTKNSKIYVSFFYAIG